MNRRRARRPAKPKPVRYRLVDQAAEPSLYQMMDRVRAGCHPELAEANILLAWRLDVKPDKDGILEIGKCKRASDLDKELRHWDFVILLNQEAWREFTDAQRDAILDHELHHAAVVLDPVTGDPKRDERGRICYRMRKHDLEEFLAVFQRRGVYRRELEQFAALAIAKRGLPLFEAKPPAQGVADDWPDWARAPDGQALDLSADAVRRITEAIDDFRRQRDGCIPNQPVADPPGNGQAVPWHDTPLAALDLPAASLHALAVAGIETLGQLANGQGLDDRAALAERLVETAHLGRRAAGVVARVVGEYVAGQGGCNDA